MFRSLIASSVAALWTVLGAGCGSPFLHAAATPGSIVHDPGLPGEWTCKEGTEARALIAAAPSDTSAEPYRLSLTVYDKGAVKSSLNIDLTLTEIGKAQYADLFLARSERDKIVGTYGFLAVPVHRVFKVSRDGDTLRVWPFQGEWLEDQAKPAEVSRDRVAVGGDDVTIITASTDRVREMLSRHADDPKAFGDVMVFHRSALKR